jgi:hypothetical protein
MSSDLPALIGIDPERLQIFEDCFSGYHCVCLEKPYHVDYASQNLCNLLGFSHLELQLKFKEDPTFLVPKQEKARLIHYLDALASKEQTLNLQYKLRKKDGKLITVFDTSTSKRLEDGKMYAFSVLSEVPKAEKQKSFGEILSGMLPYGYLQCSCEKFPRITYMNEFLRKYLCVNESDGAWENYARENIYFMLPFEERTKFRLYLEEAEHSSKPIAIDHHVHRNDGSLVRFKGWASTFQTNEGTTEYAIFYRQVEEVDLHKPIQDTSFFPVLKRSYNAIFNLNTSDNVAELIHVLDESPISSLFGVKMSIENAVRFFIDNYIIEDDKSMMEEYLKQISNPNDDWEGRTLLQADYHVNLPDGLFRCLAIAVRLDESNVMLCCRNITNLTYKGSTDLESETLHSFYDWMDTLTTIDKNNLGMFMIDEGPEGAHLLYGTSRVLLFLGLDSELGPHRSKQPTLKECLDSAGMTDDDWNKLVSGTPHYLWSRTVPDAFQFQLTSKTYHRDNRTLYLIWCTQIPLPESEKDSRNSKIFVRTFGHFDVFVDNKPITFSSAKEKELLALLIDRNGGTLSPSEAITYLWEDEPADEHTSARYRKLAMGLKRTLEKYSIEDIIINHNGVRSIDTSLLTCDYYELLDGNPKYKQAFHNSYMTDYSWSEDTLATLWDYTDDT